MSVAAAIRRMIAAGLSVEHALIAAEAMEAETVVGDPQAERRRQADRDRKRDVRLRNSAESAESAESADTPSPSKEGPHTPKETQPYPSQENTPLRGVQKKGRRIPNDFEPDIDWAIALGLSPAQAQLEAAKFRDYWIGKTGQSATKTDWPATWRNWVRTAVERTGQPRASPASQKPTLAAAFGQLTTELRRRNETRSGTGDSGVQPPLLDLPAIRHG